MTIEPISAFSDNYIWCLINSDTQSACLVDPGESGAAIRFLEANNLQLEAILITHHHNDHIGGVSELKQRYHCHVIAGKYDAERFEHFKFADTLLEDGEHITLFATSSDPIHLSVMHLPGHTLSHIAFYNEKLLFCGDTLFRAGCGRRFEGSAEQFYQSLQRLSQLPDETRVYCTHEYTLANLAFAQAVEPNNSDIKKLIQWSNEQRQFNKPTLPSTIASEKATNPFLRGHIEDVYYYALKHAQNTLVAPSEHLNPIQVFDVLRQQKDHF